MNDSYWFLFFAPDGDAKRDVDQCTLSIVCEGKNSLEKLLSVPFNLRSGMADSFPSLHLDEIEQIRIKLYMENNLPLKLDLNEERLAILRELLDRKHLPD